MASALAVAHSHFSNMVDISEVVEGLPRGTKDFDLALLMSHRQEAIDAILAIALVEAVLRGPLRTMKGDG